MTNDDTKVAQFEWNETRTKASLALADGKTQQQVADECAIGRRTVVRWLEHPEFAAEVDRLSVMTNIAARAERLRIAKRVVRQLVKDEQKIKTEKDLLDWLKYAQSETDGAKLDLTAVAEAYASVAGKGSN